MYKKVFGYTRVSTLKQGAGVSLTEQKEAIMRYAAQNNLQIVEWFEEKETAAKQGRPLFSAMLKKLKSDKASGVVIHKIDRSARNLKDWNELSELSDSGIDVHFAHESLDMQARGGRLSADIQAVIASDYVRNLRQETIKGLYGRLKQGIYPFRAPAGYLDNGGGRPKTIDPVQGPLVKKTFELYQTRQYSLNILLPLVTNMGLRNIRGNKLCINSLSLMLHNPFYMGLITIKGQSFKGVHQPLISGRLFQDVQNIFMDKSNEKIRRHNFFFRKKIRCANCGHSLIGEMQKGRTYYRCHTKNCITKGLRETFVNKSLERFFEYIQFKDKESCTLKNLFNEIIADWESTERSLRQSAKLQLARLNERLSRLTDAYIDGLLERNIFESKKSALLKQIISQEKLAADEVLKSNTVVPKVYDFLELASSLKKSFDSGTEEERKDLVETATSNLSAFGKNLEITMASPFFELLQHSKISLCDPQLEQYRTSRSVLAFTETAIDIPSRETLTDTQLKDYLQFVIDFYRKEAAADEGSDLSTTT